LKIGRSFLVVNVFILLLSLLTALRVLPGPEAAGVSLAFYSLFLLPGYTITRLLTRGRCGILEDICGIFTAGLLFLTLLLALGFVPGVSYRGIAIAGFVSNLLLLTLVSGFGIAGDRRRDSAAAAREEKRLSGPVRIVVVVLLFALCFVFFYGSGETGRDSDALDHISYVRRGIDSGKLFPGDSFHREGDGVGFDPRKGIWHPMMALWAFQGDTSVVALWRVLPAFIAFFALASFLFFAVTVTGRPLVAPLVLLMFLLFYRGEGIGWLTKAGFSRNMAQMALWSGAAFIIRYAESGVKRLLYWVFAAAFFGAACHLVFALNMAVTCLALLIFVLFFRYGRSWRKRAVTAMAVTVAAAAVPLALRALFTPRDFNIVHTHRQGMLILSDRFAMVDPAELVARMGPAFFFALLLIPFFVWSADGGERRKLTWTLFLLPVLLTVDPLTGGTLEGTFGYLHYRMLYAAPLFCYLGLAVAGLFRIVATGRAEVGDRSAGPSRTGFAGSAIGGEKRGVAARIGGRILAAGLLVVFVYLPLRLSAPVVRLSVEGILRHERTDDRMELAGWLDSVLPDHSIIASDPRTSYVVSAFTDHFVAVTLDQHCSPVDTTVIRRLRETRDLFSPAVPFSKSSPWLLEQGIEYLLVDTAHAGRSDFFGVVPAGGAAAALRKFRECGNALEEIAVFEGFHLFGIDREILAAGGGNACDETAGGEVECPPGRGMARAPDASSDGVVLEWIETEASEISAGDTLRGRICWSVDDGIEFGLPFEWTIRLDGDFPRGMFYRHWYGKQYRRLIEQRSGGFYRYTHSERCASGAEQPDQWEPGRGERQDFAFPVTEWLHEGEYVARVSVRRLAYIPNRTIGDYFLNEDSFHGVPFASLRIRGKGESTGGGEHAGGQGE